MNLLLIRHGETRLNVGRVLQPADTPLSERGLAQAAALGQRLARLELAGIVSSDLPRAAQTAAQIAAATHLPVSFDERLRERNFGDLRGLPYDHFEQDPLQMDAAPPNGESMEQFHARVAAAFGAICRLQERLGGPLAVVSHGLVVRAMLSRHVTIAAGQVLPLRMRNGSLSVVAAVSPHAAELLDCIRHLDTESASAGSNLSGG